MQNGKINQFKQKNFYILVCTVFILLCGLSTSLFTGCTTVNPGSSAAVFEHQRQLVELEATVRRYDEAVGDAIAGLDELTTRSKSMEGTIDETIQLFDEYQRRVEQIVRALEAVRSEAKVQNESNPDSGSNSDTSVN